MRYSGTVGYMQTLEVDPINKPGIFYEKVTEYPDLKGKILSNRWSNVPGRSTNDDYNTSTRISVVCNREMLDTHQFARWIEWNGVKWEISSIEVKSPQLIFTLGGMYNANSK